jgi:regulator of sigma D
MLPVPPQLARRRSDNEVPLIARWRLQRTGLRKHLLQLMCSQLSSAAKSEQEACLEHLCGELLDYISIGHFEVYNELMRRPSGAKQELQILLAYLFRCIGSSTDLVLDFNASCERADVFVCSNQMTEALTKLTRSLLVRFALEEQMLELSTEHNNWPQAPRM